MGEIVIVVYARTALTIVIYVCVVIVAPVMTFVAIGRVLTMTTAVGTVAKNIWSCESRDKIIVLN